jgi:hypothetical protein
MWRLDTSLHGLVWTQRAVCCTPRLPLGCTGVVSVCSSRSHPAVLPKGDDLRFRVVHRPTRTREFLFKPSVLCCFLRELFGMLQVASVAYLPITPS